MAKGKAASKDRNITHEDISQKELLELVLQYCREQMATKEDVQKAARETEGKLNEELKLLHEMLGQFKLIRWAVGLGLMLLAKMAFLPNWPSG